MIIVISFAAIYWFALGAIVFHSLQRKLSFQRKAGKYVKFKPSLKLHFARIMMLVGCSLDIVVYESLDYAYFWFGYFVISFIIAEVLSIIDFKNYKQLYDSLENEELLSTKASDDYDTFKADYLSNNPFNFLYEGVLVILAGFVSFWMYNKLIIYLNTQPYQLSLHI